MRFALPALIVGLVLIALAGAAAIVASRLAGPSPPRFVAVEVGADRLTLSSAYLRADSRQGGAMDALELAAFYPDFAPAGDVADINARTDLADRFDHGFRSTPVSSALISCLAAHAANRRSISPPPLPTSMIDTRCFAAPERSARRSHSSVGRYVKVQALMSARSRK